MAADGWILNRPGDVVNTIQQIAIADNDVPSPPPQRQLERQDYYWGKGIDYWVQKWKEALDSGNEEFANYIQENAIGEFTKNKWNNAISNLLEQEGGRRVRKRDARTDPGPFLGRPGHGSEGRAQVR